MRMTALLAGAVLAAVLPLAAGAEVVAGPSTQPAATRPASLSQAQIDSLTSPIALFPDTLITQILYAAAHPGDIPAAFKWATENPKATDAEVDKQAWHPSIKALVRVPSVLQTMNDNPAWTQELGNAFTNQRSDVMASIARLRKAALAAAPVNAPEAISRAPAAPSYVSSQPVEVPEVTPVYQPAFSATFSTYVPYFPVFGSPYGLQVGPQIIITGGGGGGGTTIIQNGPVGMVGPVNPQTPGPRTISTSQSSFGYNPAAARRGNVSPFVNAPAAPTQSGGGNGGRTTGTRGGR